MAVSTALEIAFWTSAALIAWTQAGYPLLIALLARVAPAPAPAVDSGQDAREAGGPRAAPAAAGTPSASQGRRAVRPGAHPLEKTRTRVGAHPSVSLIVAAHDEQDVIAARVANARELDYPRELLELIVACDGCADATAERARAAGADVVLELPRGGKVATQDAAVARARAEIVAFSDANALWAPDALRELVAAFADPRVGYACGRVRFVRGEGGEGGGEGGAGSAAPQGQGGEGGGEKKDVDGGTANQEGMYWRWEMALRARESRLCSVTAGNGAIYATRRSSYIVVDPIMGHDLSFPFNMVKRGWRAIEAPGARASEKMVPSIEGEWRRKRRMMAHTWPIVLRGGMLSPRGYPPAYAGMLFSHRLLRYCLPFLHALALACNVALVALGAGAAYVLALALQIALLLAAALAPRAPARFAPARPLLIARYYVLTVASSAAGLWDWLRHGTEPTWQAAEGTR
jgi:poly-beta-1,6-N-acetyl-D-glucosamine synthase